MRTAPPSVFFSTLAFALAGPLASAPALASISVVEANVSQPAEAGPPAEQSAKDKPKLVCRTIRNTGFRTAARKCKTQQAWDEEEAKVENGEELRMKSGTLNSG